MQKIWAATLKGLYCLGDSFGVPSIHFRFVSSSQTFVSVLKTRKFALFGDNISCAVFIASWAAIQASLMCNCQSIMLGRVDVHVG
jgi:hypothetical protein